VSDHDELAMQAWAAMIAVVLRTTRAAEAATANAPVTATQFHLLRTLADYGPARQVDLAERTGTTAASVSQLVGRLEDAGYVERIAQGRTNYVHLVDRGAAVVDELIPQHSSFITERFASLATDRLVALVETLDILLAQQQEP